jgi:acyl dehydratase
MSALPPFVRRTTFANWNRYAAVNDEFIDIHMDADAARAAGLPDAIGMGNLRLAYLHNLLHDWVGGEGDIVELRCEFRGLNLRGDTLACHAETTGEREVDGHRLVDLDIGVRNQDGAETTPGTATVVRFAGTAAMPPLPPPTQPSGAAAPGTFLDAATVAKIGRVLPPVSAPPVGANDIARWAVATYWPERPPAEFLDPAVAEKGPWGGIVAPRDFDPFAWMPDRPWSGDWLYGMGTEPGTRVLNGGQHNLYGVPIRPGDVISVTRRFVDVVEHQTKRGPMVFFTSEMRWENQDGELIRVGEQTTIYY